MKTRTVHLTDRVFTTLLGLSIGVLVFSLLATTINFIAHGGNSNNGANLRTDRLWILIAFVFFLCRLVVRRVAKK